MLKPRKTLMWFVTGILILFVRVSTKPSILKHPRIRWMLYWSLMVIIGYFVSMYIFRILVLHHQWHQLRYQLQHILISALDRTVVDSVIRHLTLYFFMWDIHPETCLLVNISQVLRLHFCISIEDRRKFKQICQMKSNTLWRLGDLNLFKNHILRSIWEG